MLMVWLAHARALERWSGDLCTYSSLDRARVRYTPCCSLLSVSPVMCETREEGAVDVCTRSRGQRVSAVWCRSGGFSAGLRLTAYGRRRVYGIE